MSMLSFLGISTAYAATAATGAAHSTEGSLMSMLPMIIAFVLLFYFLLIRPQSKRAKEHKNLINQIAKGDEIVTNSGIYGKIVKMDETTMVLNIAENVDITIQKAAIANAVPKGTIK